MSIGALQSEVNSLERELSRLRDINHYLRGELNTVTVGARRAHLELEEYNAHIQFTMENADDMMKSSHHTIVEAYELQGEIEKLYTRFKHIELANKKIRACNNKKYYEFANYRTVRKIVQGMMDNLDIRMIGDQTITKSVEAQHLQVPDYWLTCVLISIMAWKNDDQELAERAISRAVALDKKHSAVFYMLFNLRMARDEAALKWFYVYQECELKGSDQRTFLMLFSLVSRTLAESVDEKTRDQIFGFINQVIDNNAKAKGFSEHDIHAKILYFYSRMPVELEQGYPLLEKHCTAFGELRDILAKAKNNMNILQFILQTVNVPVEQKNAFLKHYIDELIASPNQVEEGVYTEIAFNELVIKHGGDLETARAKFEVEQKRQKNDLNLISEMIDWIFHKENQEVNGQIRLSMFTLTKAYQEKSVALHVEGYRSRRTSTLPVEIGEYTATVDFEQEEAACEQINEAYTTARDLALAAVKNLKAYIAFGIAAAAGLGAYFVDSWFLAGTALGVGYGIYALIANHRKRKELHQVCSESINRVTDTLRKLFEEFRVYQHELNEYDGYYDEMTNEFSKL